MIYDPVHFTNRELDFSLLILPIITQSKELIHLEEAGTMYVLIPVRNIYVNSTGTSQ